MLKITDTNYILPEIHALRASHVLESGTTEPMLIHGVNSKTGERGQYVVKYINNPRMSMKSSCFELWGAWIGNEIGINVAEPVIINISDEFTSTLIGRKGYNNALKSIGLNFGTSYNSGMMELVNGKFFLEKNLIEQAENIFAFDMFISNADRGAGKPNVLSNGDKFMIYDHELAFSFIALMPFFRNRTPWLIGETEREMYEKHHFFPYLKNRRVDFPNFVLQLSNIDENFWDSIEELTPNEWFINCKNEFEDIKNYLNEIISHKEMFSEELTRILLT